MAVCLIVVLVVVVVVTAGRGPGSRTDQAAGPPSYHPGRTVLSDTFNRSVKRGWGDADVGGAYSTSSGQGLTVVGGVGTMVLPAGAGRAATLSGAQPRDLVASVSVEVPAVTARGSGVFIALRARCEGTSCYQASLRFTPDRRAFLSISRLRAGAQEPVVLVPETVAAKDVRPGQKFILRLQTTGLTPVSLAASATRSRASQEWQIRTVDDGATQLVAGGSVALWSYLSKSSRAARTVRFDDLAVVQLIPDAPAAGAIATSAGPSRAQSNAGPAGAEGSVDRPAKVSVPGRGDTGAVPVGRSRYPVPENAVFVDDSEPAPGRGTREAPYRSIQRAVAQASSDSTIVLRAGDYHESVVLPKGRRLTLQAYPGEAAWLDGSSPVSGWRRSGRTWVVDDWTHFFDASPTYTKGAPEDPRPGWQFVNKQYPMAAHPDQLWVDGRAQQQVGARAQVRPGRFFVDRRARQLVVGADPTGRKVRASTLDTGLTVVGRGDVVRGLGVRRYATSVWQLGAATVAADGVSMQNIVLSENATTGLSVFAADVDLDRVTAIRNGLMGLHANDADRLRGSRLLSSDNNVEHFNRTPSAGGMKITKSADVAIRMSRFSDNEGHGLWFDAGCARLAVTGNRLQHNTAAGVVVEISSRAVVAGNLVMDNGLHGVWIIDTDRVDVANNTIADNRDRGIDITMDGRWKASHGTMPWIIRDIAVTDNVVSGPSTSCVVCVEDDSALLTPEQMSVAMDHNLYHRPGGTAPTAAVLWPSGHAADTRFDDLEDFRSATGQAAHSVLDTGSEPVVLRSGRLADRGRGFAPVTAGLAANVASLLGRDPGTRQLGAWIE